MNFIPRPSDLLLHINTMVKLLTTTVYVNVTCYNMCMGKYMYLSSDSFSERYKGVAVRCSNLISMLLLDSFERSCRLGEFLGEAWSLN